MITKEQKALVLKYMGKMTDRELGKLVGIKSSEVFYLRSLAGVPAYKRYVWNDIRVKELIEYRKTHTNAECAEHFGITVGTFCCVMTKLRKRGYYIPYQTMTKEQISQVNRAMELCKQARECLDHAMYHCGPVSDEDYSRIRECYNLICDAQDKF